MISLDDLTKEDTEEHTDYPYRILTIGNSGSGKINSLLNLISQQPHFDKISI